MTISLDVQDGVAVVTMNDGKANVFNPPAVKELSTVLSQAEADASAKAVVITGMPGKFSAGFDLKFFQSSSMEDNISLVESGGRLCYQIFNLGKPVIAAINGHAIAMGVFLALSCDRRIGVTGDFKIGANETVNGMVIPRFAIELIRFRLKPNFFDEAAVMARLYDPEAALEAGYLDSVVAPEALMETALATAGLLAQLPADAYAGNKRLIREPILAQFAEDLGVPA